MQTQPNNFEDKMSRKQSDKKIVQTRLLKDYMGGLKNQLIFLDPESYAKLKDAGIVGEKEETNGNL